MSWIIQGNQLVNTENTFDMPQSEVVSECVWKVNGNTLRTGILPDDMSQAKMTSPCSWKVNGNTLRTGILPDDMSQAKMTSPCSWKVNGNALRTGILPDDMLVGAFANANHLKKVTIPESVSYIGDSAFKNTALSSVKISADCAYGSESFPKNCNVEFY